MNSIDRIEAYKDKRAAFLIVFSWIAWL